MPKNVCNECLTYKKLFKDRGRVGLKGLDIFQCLGGATVEHPSCFIKASKTK